MCHNIWIIKIGNLQAEILVQDMPVKANCGVHRPTYLHPTWRPNQSKTMQTQTIIWPRPWRFNKQNTWSWCLRWVMCTWNGVNRAVTVLFWGLFAKSGLKAAWCANLPEFFYTNKLITITRERFTIMCIRYGVMDAECGRVSKWKPNQVMSSNPNCHCDPTAKYTSRWMLNAAVGPLRWNL